MSTLFYPVSILRNRKARMGQPEHATYSISLESHVLEHGKLLKECEG
jgi:hypothetical protein